MACPHLLVFQVFFSRISLTKVELPGLELLCYTFSFKILGPSKFLAKLAAMDFSLSSPMRLLKTLFSFSTS